MVKQTLDELRTALTQQNRPRAIELVGPLMDEFAAARNREEALERRAIVLQERTGGTVAHAAKDVRAGTSLTARAQVSVDIALRSYLDGEPASDVVAAIDDAIETYDAFEETVDTLDDTTADVDVQIPPVLTAAGLRPTELPKGASLDVAFTVENHGGTTTGSVSITVDSTDDLGVEPMAVDPLDPNESATVSLTGTPSWTDTNRVTIVASSDEAMDSVTVPISVITTRSYLERVLNQMRDLLTDLREAREAASKTSGGSGNGNASGSGSGPGGKHGSKGFEPKLEQVTRRTVKAIEAIDTGLPRGSVEGRIDAAHNQITAFRDHVDAQSGKALESDGAATVDHTAASVQSTLEAAKEAEQ